MHKNYIYKNKKENIIYRDFFIFYQYKFRFYYDI